MRYSALRDVDAPHEFRVYYPALKTRKPFPHVFRV